MTSHDESLPGHDLAGSCVCGSITWHAAGPARPIIECHCHRCQKLTGGHMAATAVSNDRLSIDGSTLTWYSPIDDPNVAYGFCGRCGSSLFYRSGVRDGSNEITSICVGSIDGPSGLEVTEVWWSDQAADHHRLPSTAVVFETEPDHQSC